jgi:hypothetical protein
MYWKVLTAIGVAAMLTAAGAVWAGESELGDGVESMDPEVFGLGENMLYVSAEEFTCDDPNGDCIYRRVTDHFWGTSNYETLYASVDLPAGALITGYRVFYNDASTGFNMAVSLRRGWQWGTARGEEEIEAFVSSGSPGVASSYDDVVPDYTVHHRVWNLSQYRYQSFYLQVNLPPTTTVQIRGVGIYWRRQVRAAPAVATFNDVPTGHWAFQYIEALNASGITSGCGGGSFCPDSQLSRAEMAIFLAKALGLHYGP